MGEGWNLSSGLKAVKCPRGMMLRSSPEKVVRTSIPTDVTQPLRLQKKFRLERSRGDPSDGSSPAARAGLGMGKWGAILTEGNWK